MAFVRHACALMLSTGNRLKRLCGKSSDLSLYSSSMACYFELEACLHAPCIWVATLTSPSPADLLFIRRCT
jgi:hypothetical protein